MLYICRSTPIYKDFKSSLRSPKDFYNQTPMVTSTASSAAVYENGENESAENSNITESTNAAGPDRSSTYLDLSKRKSITEGSGSEHQANSAAKSGHTSVLQVHGDEHAYEDEGDEGFVEYEDGSSITQHRPFQHQPFPEYEHMPTVSDRSEEDMTGQYYPGHHFHDMDHEGLLPRQQSEEDIHSFEYERPDSVPTIDLVVDGQTHDAKSN